MSLKTRLIYSPNFSLNKRKKKQIKFIIFHYTGIKSENKAIERLTKIQSQVSSHYLINLKGEIITIVPDLYIAWHAGISSWKNFNYLNNNSIGIEITNPGHQFGYKKFSLKQISSIIKLSKILIKKYKISKKNILGHSDIAPDRKKDPGEKFPWHLLSKNEIGLWHDLPQKELELLRLNKTNLREKKLFIKNIRKIGYSNKSNNLKFIRILVKAFQRRFRQEQVNGKIDQECLIISKKIASLYR